MVVSVDQRILCVNNVETVFLGVTIKVQDEILERDVGGRIPVHRITDANQRVAVSSGVSRLIDVPKHKMVSLDIDQLFRAADEADSFERGALEIGRASFRERVCQYV